MMLDKIRQILISNRDIDGFKIKESRTEAIELFLVKKNVDMDRAKNVNHFIVTVYKDIEENGKKFTGSSTINIHPSMNDSECAEAIRDAAFAAQFVKNPYYPLVKPTAEYKEIEAGKFSKGDLTYWINELSKAIYKNDIYEKGGINSCEIFLNKVYTRIINSEGVNAESIDYEGMVEFITIWKDKGEEVELYRCMNFSDFDPDALSGEVETMTCMCKEKAIAKNTPVLEKSSVILTRDAVKDLFSFYLAKSSAEAVYKQESTWKPGDKVQGEDVKGDLITITLDPFMKNSTCTGSFDEDGFLLEPVIILENGVLKRYIADTRHAWYLGVEPTGSIENMVVKGGSKSINELRQEPCLETAAFSDFTVDDLTGDFCGEIRLAWYIDGGKAVPVTGGSISGNINELHDEMFLSGELQKDNNFEGPKAVKLLNVTISGV